jgi:hypothetical protein
MPSSATSTTTSSASRRRSSVRKEAVVADTRSQFVDDVVPRSLERLRGPVRFLRAPRGLLDDAPLYTEERVAAWAGRIVGFSSATVPDVNHYTSLMSERGARAIAGEARQLARGGSSDAPGRHNRLVPGFPRS